MQKPHTNTKRNIHDMDTETKATHRQIKLSIVKEKLKGGKPNTLTQFNHLKQVITTNTKSTTQREQCYTSGEEKCLNKIKAEYQANGGTLVNHNSHVYPEWRGILDRMIRCRATTNKEENTDHQNQKSNENI